MSVSFVGLKEKRILLYTKKAVYKGLFKGMNPSMSRVYVSELTLCNKDGSFKASCSPMRKFAVASLVSVREVG